MSILRLLIRATTVAALRDKTWAGINVYDSDLTPFGQAVLGKAASPYIVVYTDADDINPVGGKAEVYDGDARSLSVVIEIGVASAVRGPAPTAPVPPGSSPPVGPIVVTFAQTDAGKEAACDAVEAQVMSALIGGASVDSPWADIWKRMVYHVDKITRRRGGQSATGVRFAARRVTLQCCTNYDFAPGDAPDARHPVNDFLALAVQDVQHPTVKMSEYATIVQQLLSPTDAPDWRIAQSMLGLDTEGVQMVVPTGTPLPWPIREEPPLDYSDGVEYPPQLDKLSTNEEEDVVVDVTAFPETPDPNPLRPFPPFPEIKP